MHQGRQLGSPLHPSRGMMKGDRVYQLIGQIPPLGQPAADLGMGDSQNPLLGLADIEIFRAHHLQNLDKILGKVLAENQLADIVQNASGKSLSLDPVVQLAGQQSGRHPAGDAVLPELLAIEGTVGAATGKTLQHRNTQSQALHGLETENHHRVIDRGDFARESVEGRIGQFEDFGGEGLVGRNDARDISRRGLRIVYQADYLSNHGRQGRQTDDALGYLSESLLSLFIQGHRQSPA